MRDYSQSSGRSVGQNVGDVERWVSIAAGLGLSLVALSRGGLLQRLLAGAASVSLLSRGFSGYSGMKAAWTGQTSLGEGMREQIERTRFTFAGAPTAARQIDSLEMLYLAEAQELRSAEAQFVSSLERLLTRLGEQQLQQQLRGYATELRSRCDDLDRILASRGVNPRRHPDQAMQALLNETRKMAQVAGSSVRDAALVASIQRILHYKIAGYGNVAAYAKALDRSEEAARFAEYADRDKALDGELTQLAQGTLNPQARAQPAGIRPETRTH